MSETNNKPEGGDEVLMPAAKPGLGLNAIMDKEAKAFAAAAVPRTSAASKDLTEVVAAAEADKKSVVFFGNAVRVDN